MVGLLVPIVWRGRLDGADRSQQISQLERRALGRVDGEEVRPQLRAQRFDPHGRCHRCGPNFWIAVRPAGHKFRLSGKDHRSVNFATAQRADRSPRRLNRAAEQVSLPLRQDSFAIISRAADVAGVERTTTASHLAPPLGDPWLVWEKFHSILRCFSNSRADGVSTDFAPKEIGPTLMPRSSSSAAVTTLSAISRTLAAGGTGDAGGTAEIDAVVAGRPNWPSTPSTMRSIRFSVPKVSAIDVQVDSCARLGVETLSARPITAQRMGVFSAPYHLTDGFAIAGDHDVIASPAAERIDRNQRCAVRLVAGVQWLDHDHPPAVKRLMLHGRRRVPDDFRQVHVKRFPQRSNDSQIVDQRTPPLPCKRQRISDPFTRRCRDAVREITLAPESKPRHARAILDE